MESTNTFIIYIYFFLFFFITTGESTCNTLSSSASNQGDNTVSVAQCCTTHVSTDSNYDSQNHRWIAPNNRDVHRVMKTKFPATVMVFGMLSSDGHIMPPHIFEVGLKVNTKVYLDVLKSVVIPWCKQVAGGRPWVWQQDSAPNYKSKETQAWLQKECYDFIPFSHCPLLTRPEPAGLLR